jgi:hypothetical protein
VTRLFGLFLGQQIAQNRAPEWIGFHFQPISVIRDIVALDEVLYGASGIVEGAAKGRALD